MDLGPAPVIPKKIRVGDLLNVFENFMGRKYHNKVTELSGKMKNEDGVRKSIDIILDKLNPFVKPS